MKKIRIATLGVVVFWMTGIVLPCRAEAPEQGEWRSLFNGKNLDGWDGNKAFWRVEEGVIVGETTADNRAARNTYLIWRGEGDKPEEPADFELKFQYRLITPWVNSGIQVRSVDRGNYEVAGYQPDIASERWITGILYEERGRGVVARRGERVAYDADGGRKVERFATEDALFEHIRKDEWNDYHVLAIGPTLRTKINGQLMHELTDLSPQARLEGVLAFQLHSGPPMTIYFRNIKLKEISR